jgi:RNA polymerase sigma factor (sigma-70 family)
MDKHMEHLVDQAQQGHSRALEQIVIAIQDKVYAMALRMVGHPEDARDETQEILIKVITNIGGFRKESRFMTWVYRIAANHLINTRKLKAELLHLSFERFEELIVPCSESSTDSLARHQEEQLLVEEMKHTCVKGSLLCLSRDVRLAFILGEVFEVSSDEGAFILEISPEAFRKRLSRGRALIRNFMRKNCGQVNPKNQCQCKRQVYYDIKVGYINPNRLIYAGKTPESSPTRDAFMAGLDELGRIATLFKNYPSHPTPDTFVTTIKSLLHP